MRYIWWDIQMIKIWKVRRKGDDNYPFVIHQLNLFYVTLQFRISSGKQMRAADEWKMRRAPEWPDNQDSRINKKRADINIRSRVTLLSWSTYLIRIEGTLKICVSLTQMKTKVSALIFKYLKNVCCKFSKRYSLFKI